MSTNSQPIVLVIIPQAASPHVLTNWGGPSSADFVIPQNPAPEATILRRPLSPARVDAVITHLSDSVDPVELSTSAALETVFPGRTRTQPAANEIREEMAEELEKQLAERTYELHEAHALIDVLSNAAHLERTRGNLGKIHAALKGAQRQVLNREATR